MAPRSGEPLLVAEPRAEATSVLRVRWLGSVRYRDAHAVQHALYSRGAGADDWLLLLEHPHVFTLGPNADPAHVLVDVEQLGAELVETDRGGDVTYHGPGQLVGYPILTVPGKRGGGMADTVAYVSSVQRLLIDVLGELGLDDVGCLDGFPGVWVAPESDRPRKIAAIGVRLSRGRSMHGFALNVDPDLAWFDYIVPCGIEDKEVTSLAVEGVDTTMREVVDLVAIRATERWGAGLGGWERSDVVWRHRPEDLAAFSRGEGPGEAVRPTPGVGTASPGTSIRLRGRLEEAGITGGIEIGDRKPHWMRAPLRIGDDYLRLKKTMRDLELATVCEEAGCPNIFECWSDGTATFMINGERCTRACGFCLVDTRRPAPLDPTEPQRVAEAVAAMGLDYAVLTAVARDDLADDGAGAFAACIDAIHQTTPHCSIEVLIPDCQGDPVALGMIFDARPDVLNHNLETVARLQRAVRPAATYTRSLAVLARAKQAGLTTKSGLIVGMGETDDEVDAALGDIAGIGVDIVTIGQYLRPTTNHLPVARWVEPSTFERFAATGTALGIAHVEASPLTRSSYHARQAAAGVQVSSQR